MNANNIQETIDKLREAVAGWINEECPLSIEIENIINEKQLVQYFLRFSEDDVRELWFNLSSIDIEEIHMLYDDFNRSRRWKKNDF